MPRRQQEARRRPAEGIPAGRRMTDRGAQLPRTRRARRKQRLTRNVHYAAAANDVQLARRLWQASEALTGVAFPTSLDLHNPGPCSPCCVDSPLEEGLAPGWSWDLRHRRSA